MDKLLKVLVVVVLVLSGVAVAVEVMLFLQREELKGRNIKLMDGAIRIGSYIEAPPETAVDLATRDLARLQLGREEFKNFFLVGADGKVVVENGVKKTEGPGTLDAKLKEVAAKAEIQYTRLNDTRLGLEQTRGTLNATSNTLVSTEKDLSQTKDTLKKTETDLTASKEDADRKAGQITELSQQKTALESDVEAKKGEIIKLTDKLSDKDSQLEATKRFVEKLQKDLASIMHGFTESNAPPPGLQGQILIVNTNWNFVVMDIMPEGRMIPMTDLTIQRADKLVGKVRISEVMMERRFAFGEILVDWQQVPIAKGDYVFY
jgi:hypothetical protein